MSFFYELLRILGLLDKHRLKFLFLSLYIKIILHVLIDNIVNNLLIFLSIRKYLSISFEDFSTVYYKLSTYLC